MPGLGSNGYLRRIHIRVVSRVLFRTFPAFGLPWNLGRFHVTDQRCGIAPITTEVSALQSDSTNVGSNIDTKAISDLPLNAAMSTT